MLPEVTSFYRWEGREKQVREHPVLIKSTRERYVELEAAIRKMHPYGVPEIVAWPIETGLPEYLRWVEGETGREDR